MACRTKYPMMAQCFALCCLALSVAGCAAKPSGSKTPAVRQEQPKSSSNMDTESELPGPIFWRVRAPNGKISYVLANINLISSKQIRPEVWTFFAAADELILEVDVVNVVEWAQSRSGDLETSIGTEAFESLLLEAPGLPPEFLRKMPGSFSLDWLSTPERSSGTDLTSEFSQRAGERELNVRFLIQDPNTYLEEFARVSWDVAELQEVLRLPRNRRKKRVSERHAYLHGDALGSLTKRSDEYIQTLERGNDRWLSSLSEALDKGNVFALISILDLLSPNGLIIRMEKRGYTFTRALPGIEASMGLPIVHYLRYEECTEVFQHILAFQNEDAAPQVTDPGAMRKVMLTPFGRTFLHSCKRQVTRWYDCVMDATAIDGATTCDRKYPVLDE